MDVILNLLKRVAHELEVSNAAHDAELLHSLANFLIDNQSEIDEDIKKKLQYVYQMCHSHRGYFDIGGGKLGIKEWSNLLSDLLKELKRILKDR